MESSIRFLINNVIMFSDEGLKKGFIFIYNGKITDLGEEPPPEYELSELVYDYEGRALAVHGFSILASLTDYPFRGIENADLSVYSRQELEKFAQAGIYELLLNGITFPIIEDKYPEIIIRLLKSLKLKGALVVERGTIKYYPDIIILEKENNRVYYNDKLLGIYDDIFCDINSVPRKMGECITYSLIGSISYNVSALITQAYRSLGDRVFRILTNSYRVLGVDKGTITKAAEADLLIYSSKDPVKAVPMNVDPLIMIVRGYPPDQVIIEGDIFFDKYESLVIAKPDIDQIINRGG